MAQFKQHLNEDGIVELTSLIAFQNMSSKFNSALGVPPQASVRVWLPFPSCPSNQSGSACSCTTQHNWSSYFQGWCTLAFPTTPEKVLLPFLWCHKTPYLTLSIGTKFALNPPIKYFSLNFFERIFPVNRITDRNIKYRLLGIPKPKKVGIFLRLD